MQKKRFHFVEALMILIGTIIGAGVLGIPYVVAKSGLLLGLVNIFVLGALVLLINLYVGEIALRTKKNHMLSGYAGKYLGNWAKHLMTLTTILGIYGALTIYTLGEGQVLSAIFGSSNLVWSLIFFAVFTALLYFDLEFIAESELIISLIMVALMLAIIFLGSFHINPSNLRGFELANVFLPYGVIFFAFIGASAIPEMRAELKRDPKKLKKAIMIGSGSVILLYALFALVIVGVTGLNTTEIATIGFGNILGQKMLLLGNLFAVFSMASSFLLLGLAMKWMFKYDYGLSWQISWLLTWIVPFVIFMKANNTFVGLMGLTGAVAGGFEGIMLVLTVWYAKKNTERKPEYSIPLNWFMALVLIAVFAAGIAYQFLF